MLTNQARGEIMFYDYDSMFDRTLKMRSDINLFKNSDYIGFVTPETIEEYFDEYYKIAIEKAKDISWNYVILYAVLEYGMENQTIISADFMTLEISYISYMKIVRKLFKTCRFFFIRGRKECYYE